MTDEMRALAERVVKCKAWRWMPGMLTEFGRTSVDRETGRVVLLGQSYGEPPTAADVLPDLTDPATLGCLLALVREAWGMPSANAVCKRLDGERWFVADADDGGLYPTEAHALVAALEAAP